MFQKIVSLIVLIFSAITFWFASNRAEKGIVAKLRTIPALEAIEEAIGRTVEMGRPGYFCIGGAPVGGAETGGTIAAISMLRYSAMIASSKGAKLLAGTNKTENLPMMDIAMKTGFVEGGQPELYSYEDIRWFPTQMAYIAGTQGIYYREPAGAQLMFGTWYAETIAMLEIARRGGALMVGGTDNRAYQPYMLAICDYSLIGEEVLLASAYVSDDPQLISSIEAEDWVKFLIIGITIIGALLYAFGFTEIANILSR